MLKDKDIFIDKKGYKMLKFNDLNVGLFPIESHDVLDDNSNTVLSFITYFRRNDGSVPIMDANEVLTVYVPEIDSYSNLVAINPGYIHKELIKELKKLGLFSDTVKIIDYKEKKYEIVKANLEGFKMLVNNRDSVLDKFYDIDKKNEIVFVNCGGSLYWYRNKNVALEFYEDCILGSEGSERSRYTDIYFDIKCNLKTNKRCFSDCTDVIFRTNIEPETIDIDTEQLLILNYGVTKLDLYKIVANNYLSKNHIELDTDKYENIETIYDFYIKNTLDDKKTYYYIKDKSIVCIDDKSSNDEYWVEDFPVEDYKYADMWLKGNIEYRDYLNKKINKKHQTDLEI